MLNQYQTNSFSFLDFNTLNDNLLYLDYIDNNYEFEIKIIQPDLAYKYQGNFYGLLKELNIEKSLFFYTLYINGYKSPVDFDGLIYKIKVPIIPPIPSD